MNNFSEISYAFYRAALFSAQDVIETESGFVRLYRQDDLTSMDFVYQRRWYRRTWERSFAERTLITLAKRFAADVVREVH